MVVLKYHLNPLKLAAAYPLCKLSTLCYSHHNLVGESSRCHVCEHAIDVTRSLLGCCWVGGGGRNGRGWYIGIHG